MGIQVGGLELVLVKCISVTFCSFNVPHDVAALINLMGGPDAFERRLDASFIEGFSAGSGPANTAGT